MPTSVDSSDDLPQLPPRPVDSHKGDFGRALLVGGSRGMAGSISLSGMAALRSGAGLVTIGTPECCLETVASFDPCYMTNALPSDDDGRMAPGAFDLLCPSLDQFTAVACGPGLGESAGVDELVSGLWRDFAGPVVFDADGLNSLARQQIDLADHAGPRIMTPHPGEFARLDGQPIEDETKRAERAASLANRANAVVMLKGANSVITDGDSTHINTTGNPGMATGGTGDVLTGVITALLCQGMSPLDAARLATHLHGRAGDLAATALGQISMTARDLLAWLPDAFREAASQ